MQYILTGVLRRQNPSATLKINQPQPVVSPFKSSKLEERRKKPDLQSLRKILSERELEAIQNKNNCKCSTMRIVLHFRSEPNLQPLHMKQ